MAATGSTQMEHPWVRARALPATGFIEPFVILLLAQLQRVSLHHWLQWWRGSSMSSYHSAHRATDGYFLVWVLVVLLLGLFPVPEPGPGIAAYIPKPSVVITVAVWYRITEALVRELWIVLFRGYITSTRARPVIVSFVNYATVVGLFGYLYGGTRTAYHQAYSIGFTFSPLESTSALGWLELTQSAYCFVFTLLILGGFITGVQLRAMGGEKQEPEASGEAASHVAAVRKATDSLAGKVQELEGQLAAANARVSSLVAAAEVAARAAPVVPERKTDGERT